MAIKVMIVDDSSIVRQVMQEVLSKEPDIEVIGTAVDPLFAREKMAHAWPDVIILDIEMPRMDGITFLKQIMAERPTPVVICSSHTEKNIELSLKALSAGALGIINKPAIGFKDYIQDSSADLLTAIRSAAMARIAKVHTKPPTERINSTSKQTRAPLSRHSLDRPSPHGAATTTGPTVSSRSSDVNQERMGAPKLNADAILQAPSPNAQIPTTTKIIAIGTSTGGTQALEAILPHLSLQCAGLAIVQHMPEKFTASFAERLNSMCEIEVREAKNNDKLTSGLALIAPGGKHMLIRRTGTQYYVEIIDGPLVTRHRPSVDVLFRSAAIAAGKNAVGYILTGMGDDGAKGLLEMANSGSKTYAQNEESCVVFGMPKEAITLGAAKEIIALEDIAASISRFR